MRIVKTETDYREALREIERLVDIDPAPGTPDGDHLELLVLVVRDYESKQFPITKPDPIEAIRFRMEQQGLTQRDLVPYIGSRSKVSEVLSKKRPLTLSMIRALNSGLGIPAEALLQDRDADILNESEVEWERFPAREMRAYGYFTGETDRRSFDPEAALRNFVASAGGLAEAKALYRRTPHIRGARRVDKYALTAWTLRVVKRGLASPAIGRYSKGIVTKRFMRDVAQLSWATTGPVLALEYLQRHGIPVVVEPHLPQTRLDGAAVLAQDKQPIIGLTVRYDRLDNFWFCLMHELAHIALHLKKGDTSFYDDLDVEGQDPEEMEADRWAVEALIPKEDWHRHRGGHLRTPEAVNLLATKLRVHPAIVAGRIRHESKNFRILNQLVGHDQVKRLFPEVNWLEH